MHFLVNDCCLDGSFPNVETFSDAVDRIMRIRQWVVKNGRGIQMYCHRNMASARVTRDLGVQEATAKLSVAQRQALLQWLSRLGPFWDDDHLHGLDLHLEAQGYPVTDTAIGEAAVRSLDVSPDHGYDLISFDPSEWMFSPVEVRWVGGGRDGETVMVAVQNHWKLEQVQARTATARAPHESWRDVANYAQQECPQLLFANNAFEPLRGTPFHQGAAERLDVLLTTLNRLVECTDSQGRRTTEGDEIHRRHFTGDKAWFSPSSESEVREFAHELTFRHPLHSDRKILCSWHGKVKIHQLRIHFAWPDTETGKAMVVYVGPKITRR